MGKILIVDDDAVFRSGFKEYFDEYQIIEAGTGNAALDILARVNEVDLVILDIRMPGIDGVETLRRIRQMHTDAGIIILTGYSSRDAILDTLRLQADDFIEKPIDINRTRETINRLLRPKIKRIGAGLSDLDRKMEIIKAFVRKNCFKKFFLKDAADAVCLSSKYLSRVFKQRIGMGFSEYKLKIKIDEAKRLLLTADNTVEQIANTLGYRNSESFIRQFKKYAKSTPKDYRRKKLKEAE